MDEVKYEGREHRRVPFGNPMAEPFRGPCVECVGVVRKGSFVETKSVNPQMTMPCVDHV